jgi:hypothetical protein
MFYHCNIGKSLNFRIEELSQIRIISNEITETFFVDTGLERSASERSGSESPEKDDSDKKTNQVVSASARASVDPAKKKPSATSGKR